MGKQVLSKSVTVEKVQLQFVGIVLGLAVVVCQAIDASVPQTGKFRR